MKYFILLLSILISYSSFSQSAMKQLEQEFTSDNLSATTIKAFEKRAEQKVVDFSNYFGIITDKDLDVQLRNHSKELVYKLFIDSLASILITNSNSKVKEYALSNYLVNLQKTEHYKIIGEIDDLEIIDSLKKTEDGVYIGKIKYKHKQNFYSTENTISHFAYTDNTATVVLLRENKSFGSMNKIIWELKIKQIEIEMKNELFFN